MTTHFRKCITITAMDIPNVQRGLQQRAAGQRADHAELIPGVLTLAEFDHRMATWNEQRKCEGLFAQWFTGAALKLFPPEWRKAAVARHRQLRAKADAQQFQRTGLSLPGSSWRKAKAIGIDSGEGSANTSWSVVDELGLIELVSFKTPDTSVVADKTIELGRKHSVPPNMWGFDRGGGGYQHANYLARRGYKCRTIASGAAPQLELKRGLHRMEARKETKEASYTFISVRVQMAWDLSELMDPALHGDAVFALPDPTEGPQYAELHRQLALLPRMTDDKQRATLPPKQRRDDKDTRQTLIEIMGHSPDEFDSLANGVHTMLHKPPVARAGAAT